MKPHEHLQQQKDSMRRTIAPSCSNCQFWSQAISHYQGYCHRNYYGLHPSWGEKLPPLMSAGDCCSEHEHIAVNKEWMK